MILKAEPVQIKWQKNRGEPVGTINNRTVFVILKKFTGYIIICYLFKINDDLCEEFGIMQSANRVELPSKIYDHKEEAKTASQEYFNKYWMQLTNIEIE